MQTFDDKCSSGEEAIKNFVANGYWGGQPAVQAMMRDLYEQGRLEFRLIGLEADNGQRCTLDLPLPTGKSEILDPTDLPDGDLPAEDVP